MDTARIAEIVETTRDFTFHFISLNLFIMSYSFPEPLYLVLFGSLSVRF